MVDTNSDSENTDLHRNLILAVLKYLCKIRVTDLTLLEVKLPKGQEAGALKISAEDRLSSQYSILDAKEKNSGVVSSQLESIEVSKDFHCTKLLFSCHSGCSS